MCMSVCACASASACSYKLLTLNFQDYKLAMHKSAAAERISLDHLSLMHNCSVWHMMCWTTCWPNSWIMVKIRKVLNIPSWSHQRKTQRWTFLTGSKKEWHFVAWLYHQLCHFHSWFSLRFLCSEKSSMTQTVSLFILCACLISGHIAQLTHLSQLASTSFIFPLKQEAGDEKVSTSVKGSINSVIQFRGEDVTELFIPAQSLLTDLLKNWSMKTKSKCCFDFSQILIVMQKCGLVTILWLRCLQNNIFLLHCRPGCK